MRYFILLICVLAMLRGNAQSMIKAKQYAREYGNTLMRMHGTSSAKNIVTEISDLELDGDDYVMEIEVRWDDQWGAVFKADIVCLMKGVFTVRMDGSNKRFSETFRNDGFAKIAKGKRNASMLNSFTEAVVDGMASSSSSSSSSGSSSSRSSSSYSSSSTSSSSSQYIYMFNNYTGSKVFMSFAPYEKDLGDPSNTVYVDKGSGLYYLQRYGSMWSDGYLKISTQMADGRNVSRTYKIYPGKTYNVSIIDGVFVLTQ